MKNTTITLEEQFFVIFVVLRDFVITRRHAADAFRDAKSPANSFTAASSAAFS